ncbi:amino acid permease [Deltaproteobacteria bacterium TL4]
MLTIPPLKSEFAGSTPEPESGSQRNRNPFLTLSILSMLGANSLSSLCYGPEQMFSVLHEHTDLVIFVALATVFTLFIISASYAQIIRLFPTGGGGYLVASNLLSPQAGMLSGCALLLDYAATIAISSACAAEIVFSLFPLTGGSLKLDLSLLFLGILIILNFRGVQISARVGAGIVFSFLLTHALMLFYSMFSHFANFKEVFQKTTTGVQNSYAETSVGVLVLIFLLAYSLGASTYTGVESISNRASVLPEPRAKLGTRVILYTAILLALAVVGIMLSYGWYDLKPVLGKSLNAVLFERMTLPWGIWGYGFLGCLLIAEVGILMVAAQNGLLCGQQILASMAIDHWTSTRFASLSDRLMTQNGILIMGGLALLMIWLTQASVAILAVFYGMNVFVTFALSQMGMVRHWWKSRNVIKQWEQNLLINGVGLLLTSLILFSLVILKFTEGGFFGLLMLGGLAGVALLVKRHYLHTEQLLHRLDALVEVASSSLPFQDTQRSTQGTPELEPHAKTVVLLVNGFNGIGLHTLFMIFRLYGNVFRNFVFVQVGVMDAGMFKGAAEMDLLTMQIKHDLDRYVDFMKRNGFYAEGMFSIGCDVMDEVEKMATQLLERFPHAVFFGGQLVFPKDSFFTRWLHNYTAFALQRRLYQQGIPVAILPIRV